MSANHHSSNNHTSRRRFLATSAAGVALAGTATIGGYLVRESLTSDSSHQNKQTINTGAKQARRIAIGPQDDIYVAADRAILVFDKAGNKKSEITLPRPARCLTVDDAGSIFVGLLNSVVIYNNDGLQQSEWNSLGADAVISGISLSGDNVFVADAGNKTIHRFNRDGELLGKLDHADNHFQVPAEFFSIEPGVDGTLHVVHPGRHRVETYSSTGELLRTWGERSRTLAGFSGCCNPVSLAVLPDGGYITAERGQPRIKQYTADGTFQKLLLGPEEFAANAKASRDDNSAGCHSGGFDVAVDSTGRVLVLDRVTAEIRLIG